MKLDATVFRYMTRDEFRVLSAVEMTMKNHEFAPVPLIESIAKLNRGGTFKIMQNLLKHKLLAHEQKSYDGYRLTYKGYDFLALRALTARGIIVGVGRRLGVGKESDVHFCTGPNGEKYAMKLHRLGRISFRAIKQKRDYLQHRSHGSWMYMARLAALKEFAYMKALYDEGYPVPVPIDQNRHVVVMSMVDATPMYSIRDMPNAHAVLERLFRLVVRLGRSGIVHGDFNEFNLLIDLKNEQKITLIDFPQIVHIGHPNAEEFFDRDVRSIVEYFRKKCHVIVEKWPTFGQVLAEIEGDGGAVLKSLEVKGLSGKDDALLVAAHGAASDSISVERAPGDGLDDDSEDDDSDMDDEQESTAPTMDTDGAADTGLVPEGGRSELGELGDDLMDGALASTAGYPEATQDASSTAVVTDDGSGLRIYPNAPVATEEDAGGSGSEDSSSEDASADEEAAPGEVKIAKGKKTRKKTNAKDARANLQRQQKTKPAKANNQKVREMRNAKHNCKEVIRDSM